MVVDFFDMRSKIIKSYYPSEFTQFDMDQNKNIIRFHNSSVVNNDGRIMSNDTLAINFGNFIFSVEQPSTDNYFIEKYNKYIRILKKDLFDIKSINRLGLRGIFCLDKYDYDNIVKMVNNGVLFEKQALESIGKDFSVEDFSIILQHSNNRIELGPMKKEQNHPYVVNNFVFLENVPNQFLYLDIDVSVENFEYQNLSSHVTDLNTKLFRILNGIKSSFDR